MKNLILNTVSWLLVVSLLSLYLNEKMKFPLFIYVFTLSIFLITLGLLVFIKAIIQNNNFKNIKESRKITISRKVKTNIISISLAGVISLFTSILM
ncbi:hypothetical protein ACH36K_13345 [Clostridium sp. MB05]|uniref:hypothetical protein n=1 Tax=Clostridium sp. MB05 TaxID=3376682 RepID=UPI0039825072